MPFFVTCRGASGVAMAVMVEWLAHGRCTPIPAWRFMAVNCRFSGSSCDDHRSGARAQQQKQQGRILIEFRWKCASQEREICTRRRSCSPTNSGSDGGFAMGPAYDRARPGLWIPFTVGIARHRADRNLHGSGIAAAVASARPGDWIDKPLPALAPIRSSSIAFQLMIVWSQRQHDAARCRPAGRYRQFNAL